MITPESFTAKTTPITHTFHRKKVVIGQTVVLTTKTKPPTPPVEVRFMPLGGSVTSAECRMNVAEDDTHVVRIQMDFSPPLPPEKHEAIARILAASLLAMTGIAQG